MKKRIVSAALVLAMAVSTFAGCGQKAYQPTLPTETVESDIFVAPIDGISDDFIKGMDVSSVIAEEESGVKYYNEDGEEEDLFKILADSGLNYIRVRVWCNPYDKDGNGYGGGNCDAKKAAEIGKRAARYGMKLLVDFHYSDFWADPNKQFAPVEVEGKSVEEKAKFIKEYTTESLNAIIKEGADVGMVQIGNEINNGMCGETLVSDVMELLKAASESVRAVAKDKDKDIKIAVHYTEIDDTDDTYRKAENLKSAGVDYDIFGVSYYPFWHGSMENMQEVLSTIKEKYGKDTCVLETSYCYTGEDGDESANSVSEGDCLEDYPVSVQGQASCIRDVMSYASNAGALGVFYWEGAWVPVGKNKSSNSKLWEKYGSGWASSYAADYDPNDAGQYYGGSSWDNQAMFDFDGKALSSLNVFKYVNYGSTAPLEVIKLKEVEVESGIHKALSLPDTVEAVYNDPSVTDGVPVTWDTKQLAEVDVDTAGEYTVDGTTEDGTAVTASIKITNNNYLKNPGFEEADSSMWVPTYITDEECTDIQEKPSDAVSGDNALHFYSTADMEFYVEQKVEGLKADTYTFTGNIQGGDVGDNADIYFYVKVGDKVIESDKVTLDGWCNWKTPVVSDVEIEDNSDVTVGIYIKCSAGAWGTIDDLEFYGAH